MTYVRKDLWKLGETWNPTLLWYARAVNDLKARPLNDTTSWRFLAAIHGFDDKLWVKDGYYQPHEPQPTLADQELFWNQCQHSTWFFLPWHRPYLLSFEKIVRATIVKLGGPADWALPYWDYDDYQERPETLGLPKAFYEDKLPDGQPNPLKLPVKLRYGLDRNGVIRLDPARIELATALNEVPYTGIVGGSPGFGGPVTDFNNGDINDYPFGLLESSPHNPVHLMVGGNNGLPKPLHHEGLMSDPKTAGLDPIFWLHHANIDRLWQVWLNRDPSHHNPTESTFVDGPPAGRPFIFPDENGESTFWKVGETLDLKALGYTYESFHDPIPKPAKAKQHAVAFAAHTPVAAVKKPVVELIGANSNSVKLVGSKSATQVRLDKPGVAKVAKHLAAKSLLATAAAAPTHERIFLNLENIRGDRNSLFIDVYVNVPEGEQPGAHPELRAGCVSLFGMASASDSSNPHGGSGVSASLEITGIVDALRASGGLDLEHLQVTLYPDQELEDGDNISVGRISIYRQGE